MAWPNKIVSLVNQCQYQEALHHFTKLHHTGHPITDYLLSTFLKACGRAQSLQQGKQAHSIILKKGYCSDVTTSLLDMYSKCTKIQEACRVFDEMPRKDCVATNAMISGLCRCHLTLEAVKLFESMGERNVDSWNSMISGLAQNAEGGMALSYFCEMRFEGVKMDVMTVLSVLSVCADLAAMVNGRQVHGLVVRAGFELYVSVGNVTVDMYAKSGCMDDAWKCFGSMPSKNVVSWTSLIMGFGKHGLGLDAVNAFERMKGDGIVPNNVTFLAVLFACSHAGMVEEGWRYFDAMIHTYCLQPTMEHYTCMVDLMGRSGYLFEALEFVETMPVEPDKNILIALLGSCCSYMNVELTKYVGQRLLELEPEEAGPYMLLSNFYGLIGDLESVANVRKLMVDRGIRKAKAVTWTEINKTVHTFESGDRSHPLHEDIYNYLKSLIQKMKAHGYIPNTSLVVQNVDEYTKEEILLSHSEKLCIGLALISTPPGSRITIVKNLRICIDCHAATKLISKIEGREIIARDSNRFHRFNNGVCSCGDHW